MTRDRSSRGSSTLPGVLAGFEGYRAITGPSESSGPNEWETPRVEQRTRELQKEVRSTLASAQPRQAARRSQPPKQVTSLLAPFEADLRPGGALRDTVIRGEVWIIARGVAFNGGSGTQTARRLGIIGEALQRNIGASGWSKPKTDRGSIGMLCGKTLQNVLYPVQSIGPA